ncbi:MAG: fatty acyl-AMP ligase [Lautropia sp.]|nr:fatty acyl-AMP ligase [Lautropia sp.]
MKNNWAILLRERAFSLKEKKAFVFLNDFGEEEESLSFSELFECASKISYALSKETSAGDRVLLLYGPGLDYIKAFYACLLSGVVAVPLYAPQNSRKLMLIEKIAEDCRPSLAMTTKFYLPKARGKIEVNGKDLKVISPEDWLIDERSKNRPQTSFRNSSLAYLQYTSGSTSSPKGVMLTHAATIKHSKALGKAWDISSSSVLVSWLPHFHDLGQVLNVLQPLYYGMKAILMSPASFIKKPMLWLSAIDRYKATHSAAPDFAYMHCVEANSRINSDKLNLESWKVAVNGAEPVKFSTLKAFSEEFSKSGFSPAAHRPSYGMAETTLVISAHKANATPTTIWLDKSKYKNNEILIKPESESTDLIPLVSNGFPLEGSCVLVVDPRSMRELPERRVGEIWVSAPWVGAGYWNNQEESEHVFAATVVSDKGSDSELTRNFVRTGDLGFFHNGEIYITGREKDLIIIRGVNHYPQDLEKTVYEANDLINREFVAAFPFVKKNREELVILAERKRYFDGDVNYDNVISNIFSRLTIEHGVKPVYIGILRPGSIPKTTSGKIQRKLSKKLWLENRLNILGSRSFEGD